MRYEFKKKIKDLFDLFLPLLTVLFPGKKSFSYFYLLGLLHGDRGGGGLRNQIFVYSILLLLFPGSPEPENGKWCLGEIRLSFSFWEIRISQMCQGKNGRKSIILIRPIVSIAYFPHFLYPHLIANHHHHHKRIMLPSAFPSRAKRKGCWVYRGPLKVIAISSAQRLIQVREMPQ